MTVEELQKACAALSEAWVKAMEPLKKLPDSTRSTYAYKPVGRRNLPYQRRNF